MLREWSGSSRTWGHSQQHGTGLRLYGILESKWCFPRCHSKHQHEGSLTRVRLQLERTPDGDVLYPHLQMWSPGSGQSRWPA